VLADSYTWKKGQHTLKILCAALHIMCSCNFFTIIVIESHHCSSLDNNNYWMKWLGSINGNQLHTWNNHENIENKNHYMLMAIFLLLELMNLKQIKRQEEKRYKLFIQTKKVKWHLQNMLLYAFVVCTGQKSKRHYVSTKLMCICTLCDHSYFLFSSQIAEQKLYEHWKQNAPELREVWKITSVLLILYADNTLLLLLLLLLHSIQKVWEITLL